LFPLWAILLLISLSGLTGCALNRQPVDYSGIEAPVRFGSISALSGATEEGRESGEWWRRFDDPKLNELMETAFEANLDIAMAYERVDKARALVRVAGGAEGVQFTLSTLGGRSSTGGSTVDTYKLSGAASYELDLWGRLSAVTGAARRDMAATEEDLVAIYITVSAELADRYYVAVERRRQVELAALMVETAKERVAGSGSSAE
jgi:outer membrane protein TolC